MRSAFWLPAVSAMGAAVVSGDNIADPTADPFQSIDPSAFNPVQTAPRTGINLTIDPRHIMPTDDAPAAANNVVPGNSATAPDPEAAPADYTPAANLPAGTPIKSSNALLLIGAAVAAYFLFLKK